jgi:hypothetical protein
VVLDNCAERVLKQLEEDVVQVGRDVDYMHVLGFWKNEDKNEIDMINVRFWSDSFVYWVDANTDCSINKVNHGQ